jgi:alpha-methylacyl-CoA racemase
MLLGFGIACALLETSRSGKGQVVDAAMTEGASLLAAMFHGLLHANQWSEGRGVNVLDTGAPWYDVYKTKDAKHVAIGAIEAKFFAELASRLGLKDLPPQHDRSRWREMRSTFEKTFKSKTREEWCRVFEGSDACFAPVLSFSEARAHPHNRARDAFVELADVAQPAPAPRYSRTPAAVRGAPPERGEGGLAALRDWGFSSDEVNRLRSSGLALKEE